jgi:hypothetical protein
MRTLVMTAVATAFLTTPSQAQMAPGQTPGQAPWATLPKMDNSVPEDQHPAKEADDTAYRSALDRIPLKQANDPWGSMREKPQSKNTR